MALSQIQCLDDNHVNARTHESKPDFLYCEDQRLALEAFLRDGREAFVNFLGARGLRGFLSDPELEALAEAQEPYDPGSELFPEDADENEPPLSLHYWPELSDTSVPLMDLGWPESVSYRGVTRTTVYAQPPLESQPHIKEVIRKMIAQAQKVIAVVMDVFTDVDIFRDLLDAGFKRKVSVYILLERKTLPHFRSMCQRANMHAGHLKNLRVRCTNGTEFYTRSCTKVGGRMGHRFMFIDGDKAVSGSYSFTWMSSRLDRNLITVVTGQAVEAFDRLFRILYGSSGPVNLRQVTTEPEPEPEPLPQPAAVAPTSAAIARKLYSAKYALVALGNPSPTPSPEPKDTPDCKSPETKKRRGRRASKEAEQDAHPIHPGLDLERAYLIEYLPTWPEPDPPSDVIGFINVRDAKKPTQVHLQRSEMFETSQAIRFSSPISVPKETLPEVAKPRQFTAKHELNKPQPAQGNSKAEETLVSNTQPKQVNAGPGDTKTKVDTLVQKSPKCEPDKDASKTLNTENKRHSNPQDVAHNTTPQLNAHTPHQSTPNTGTGRSSHTTQTITTTTIPASDTKTEADLKRGNLSPQRAVVYKMHILETSSTQTSHLRNPADWNSLIAPHTQTKTVLPYRDSYTRNSSEKTPDIPASAFNSHTSDSSTPLSPLTPSFSAPKPPLSSQPPTPPIPKPRTVQLVIKGDGSGDDQKLPEFSVVRRSETSTGPLVVHNVPEKVPKTVPALQNNSGSNTAAQKDAKKTVNKGEAPQQKQSGTSHETKNEEAYGRHERAGMQPVPKAKSDVLIADVPKKESGNIHEIIPKDVEPKTFMSTDCKLTPLIDFEAPVQTEIKAPERARAGGEFSEAPNEKNDTTERKTYLAMAHVPQRISYRGLTPEDLDVLEARTDSLPNHNVHGTSQEQTSNTRRSTHTPERPLRLHLSEIHVPDFRSPTPEKESRLLTSLTQSPDGFLPGIPSPDSRTHTPDPRSYTPDFRTPTPDGYFSSRTDSALSNASEEYFECSSSPLYEPFFEQSASRNHGTTEDRVHTNPPNAATITAGPAYINYNTSVASLGSTDRNTSSSEILEENTNTNEENGKEEDEKGKEVSVAERGHQETERRSSEDTKRTANHVQQGKDSTETEQKKKEAQPQTPKRKKRPVSGEITNERTEQRRLSTGDVQPKKAPSEGKRSDNGRAALRPSSVEMRDRPPPTKDTEGQKLLHTPKSQRRQQPDSRGTSPSRPSRPPRPTSGNQALGPRRSLHGSSQALDNTSSPRRPPYRPPPPVSAGAVGSAAGRKQAETGLISQKPHAAQGRTRAGQTQNQHPYPKPEASFLHTHTNSEQQLHHHSQNQTVTPQEAHWQEDGRAPFSFTFSRLYSLKGLKDKMSKLPAQSKRGRASSPGQGRKSTS